MFQRPQFLPRRVSVFPCAQSQIDHAHVGACLSLFYLECVRSQRCLLVVLWKDYDLRCAALSRWTSPFNPELACNFGDYKLPTVVGLLSRSFCHRRCPVSVSDQGHSFRSTSILLCTFRVPQFSLYLPLGRRHFLSKIASRFDCAKSAQCRWAPSQRGPDPTYSNAPVLDAPEVILPKSLTSLPCAFIQVVDVSKSELASHSGVRKLPTIVLPSEGHFLVKANPGVCDAPGRSLQKSLTNLSCSFIHVDNVSKSKLASLFGVGKCSPSSFPAGTTF